MGPTDREAPASVPSGKSTMLRRDRPYAAILLLTSILLSAATVDAGPKKKAKRKKNETVQYGPHKRQRFKIWHAKGEGPKPVLVHFFGGAFLFGGPNGGPFKGDMNKRGITVVGGGYRFRQDGATKREILEDGARVIQYLRAHADRFCIDPNRIAVSGFSSGGVVAGWVALHDDLRDPFSTDPVLRQSSRVSVCCLEKAQVHPIDFDSWAQYTSSPLTLLRQGIYNYILIKLYGNGFVQPFEPEDFVSQAQYKRALWEYQQDVFIFYLSSSDDPPVCFYSNKSDDPAEYAKKGNGGGLHSPLLMIPLQRHLQEDGVTTLWDRKKECRDFIVSYLAS